MIGLIRPRPYGDDDLPRVQAALAGWVREAGRCGYCHVGEVPHRIYENLHGRGPVGELVHVWEDGETVVGLAINGRFGHAFDVFASPSLRGTDAELEMLRSACETTESASAGEPVITDVWECDETRAALLTRLGFEDYRVWDHIVERTLALAPPAPAARPPDGFVLRSATVEDYEQLAAVRSASFGDDWAPDDYRAQVMEKPGYDPEREIVVVAPDGRIAAFALTWVDELNKVGHFEPVGTHRDFQRRGLARAAMLHGLREMSRVGMETATVAHDATNTAAGELYRGLGFVRKHVTLGYRRR